jgi:glycosyltransferase involved in cell wall biosynthesis
VKTLYLCYFGLREPLVQTQVLPYLRQLVSDGTHVSLLKFEPEMKRNWSRAQIETEQSRLAGEGLHWHCLPYHKRPSLPATLYDVARGALLAARLVRRERVGVLHARGHVPALMGAMVKLLVGGRLVFDIRGFMPEEYTDAGVWPEHGYLYRGAKLVERYLMASSDAFVVLTEKAREILFPGCEATDGQGRPIEVIPCCVDPARFRAAEEATRDELRRELKLTNRRVFVYVGSFGGWYMTDEMTQFLALAHEQDPRTFALILTQSAPEPVRERLRGLGLGDDDFFVGRIAAADVPRYLKAADASISFIKACYSKLSSSPTKIAEYLTSGLPIVCNTGVGDLDELLITDRVGVVIHDFTPEAYTQALGELNMLSEDPALMARCQASASERFGMETVGGYRYRRLYRRLLGENEYVPEATSALHHE